MEERGGEVLTRGLLGSFTHKLDSKGRMVLPARFRDEMGSAVIATIGTNRRCIAVRSGEEWERFDARLKAEYEANSKIGPVRTVILGYANAIDIDSAGRILVPQELRNRLKIGVEVSVIGSGDHIQIWDTRSWNEWCDEIEPRFDELLDGIPGL